MESILLQACIDGFFGKILHFADGTLYDAGFVFLDGRPNGEAVQAVQQYKNRMFVCMNPAWEQALVDTFPDMASLTRHLMRVPDAWDIHRLQKYASSLPEGYVLRNFDADAFDRHPFSHGENYASFADFQKRGIGSVIWHENEIVCSASSYLSYKNAVETDISTLPEHQRKGLARCCCASMLLQCIDRNIVPHWDAQNNASRALAESLGYELALSYSAYYFS